jgi:chromosomal replication initiator protein
VVTGTFTIPLDGLDHGQQSTRLDQAFTLRWYIGGRENELVRWAVSELTGDSPKFNPLTFYGPTSIGKTTLLCGIEQCWASSSEQDVLLTNGADFDRGYAYAIETSAVPEFREKHRRPALVIIDDLQLLSNKPAAQQEFANLLDWRLDAKAPIVLALGISPIELSGLSEALASRLAGGMLVPLHLPTPATRRAILDRLLEQASLEFPVVVREAVAGQCPGLDSPFSTVPEIRHAVLQLQHAAEESGSPPSLDDAMELINRELMVRKPTLNQIAKKVARHFNVRMSDLKSASRRQWVVRARGVAFYLARQLTGDSFQRLGHLLGGRDHSTVMHACRRIKSLLESDPAISLAVARLHRELVGEGSVSTKTNMPEHRSSARSRT